MANGRDSTTDLMNDCLKVQQEATVEGKLDCIVTLLGVYLGRNIREHYEFRASLPFGAWTAKLVGGISLLTFAGLVWGASALNSGYVSTRRDAQDAKAVAVAAVAESQRSAENLAAVNAKLDLLLQSRGLRVPESQKDSTPRVGGKF